MIKKIALMMILLAIETVAAAGKVDLAVVVSGVAQGEGQVIVSLYDEKKSWLKKPALVQKKEAGDGQTVEVRFSGLDTGSYALAVVYDQDADGELNTGLFGIPAEPVGFSNDARRKFGPAKWKQAQFELTEDTTLTVNVVDVID